jgi:hypothetical protein
MPTRMNPKTVFGLLAALSLSAVALTTPASAQVLRPGPVPNSGNSSVVLLPAQPNPGAPPIPPEQIIQRVSQQEDSMLKARGGYTYRKVVRVEEIDDNGNATGKFELTTQSFFGPDGKLYEKGVNRPASTMQGFNIEPEDTDILWRIPMFPLTASQLPKYNITYAGTEKLDELTTYIFQVHPKQVERTVALFDGVVWVDTEDFVIVKTTGKWITELGEVTSPQFPFTVFDTYRENIVAKDWFPAYVRSDASVPTKLGPLHLRLTILWQAYKPGTEAKAEPPHAPQH